MFVEGERLGLTDASLQSREMDAVGEEIGFERSDYRPPDAAAAGGRIDEYALDLTVESKHALHGPASNRFTADKGGKERHVRPFQHLDRIEVVAFGRI